MPVIEERRATEETDTRSSITTIRLSEIRRQT